MATISSTLPHHDHHVSGEGDPFSRASTQISKKTSFIRKPPALMTFTTKKAILPVTSPKMSKHNSGGRLKSVGGAGVVEDAGQGEGSERDLVLERAAYRSISRIPKDGFSAKMQYFIDK